MNLEKLYEAIKSKNYEEVKQILLSFKSFLSSGTYNYLLFLLSQLYKFPHEEQDAITAFTIEDVKPSESEKSLYADMALEENVRNNVVNRKFFKAMHEIRQIEEKNDYYRICKDLICFCIENQRAICTHSLQLLNANELERYIIYKKSILSKFGGNYFSKCELQIATDLLALRNSDKIPDEIKPMPYKGNSLFSAIYARNYHKALEANTRFLADSDYSLVCGELRILLKMIVAELDKIKEANENETFTFNEIRSSFIIGKIDSGFSQIIKYLKYNKLGEYEHLIICLFDIGIIDDDFTFQEGFEALEQLPNIDFNQFKEKYEFAMKTHQYEKARMYFSILASYKVINQDQRNKMLNELSRIDPTMITQNLSDVFRKFIIRKKLNADEDGVTLLDNMGTFNANRIYDVARGLNNIQVFKTGSENEKRIAIRSIEREPINFDEEYRKFSNYFKVGDYKKVVEVGVNLLKSAQCPAWIYSLIGFAHFYLGSIKKAIPYLFISTSLCKNNQDITCDHTDFLIYLNQVNQKSSHSTIVDRINKYLEEGMELEDACKKAGLNIRQKLIVLLIYAKELLMTGDEELAMYYISRVMAENPTDKFVTRLLKDVLINMDIYESIEVSYPVFKRNRA